MHIQETMKNLFRTGLLAVFLLTAVPICMDAQNLKENRRKAEIIQMDKDYYSAFGTGKDEHEAGNVARQELMSQISSTVESAFVWNLTEENLGNSRNTQSVMKNIMKTYTAGELQESESLVIERKGGQVTMFCYVAKSKVEASFRDRENRVIQYVVDGLGAEQKGEIGVALKCFNWALGLLRTVRHPDKLTYAADGPTAGNKILLNWLPAHINDIFKNLKTEITGTDEEGVILWVTYRGKEVTQIDLKYDGDDNRSHTIGITDGKGKYELQKGQSIDNIKMAYEYAYKNEMNSDNGLRMVAEYFKVPEFEKAEFTVYKGNKREMKTAAAQFQASAQEAATPHMDFLKRSQAKDYTGTVMKIAEAIKNKKYESVKEFFTPEGYEIYDRLLHYGQARILTIPELHCYPYSDQEKKVICRSIPMQFTYPGTRRQFTENVYFTFNAQDLIECVAFGLDKATRGEIYTKEHLDAWGEEKCELLNIFLEDYKTAWALKRLDYIEGIFADNARIITGHVLKPATLSNRTPGDGVKHLYSHPLIKYTEQNKKEYMRNLAECFKSNEFINIRFTDCMIKKLTGEHFYINIHQDYYSNTYSDTGFLCLMIDVSNPLTPLIQYRTWQPERDPNINNKWTEEERAIGDGRFWGVITGSSFK